MLEPFMLIPRRTVCGTVYQMAPLILPVGTGLVAESSTAPEMSRLQMSVSLQMLSPKVKFSSMMSVIDRS